MSIKTGLIAELTREAAMTKKILERVPLDKKDWTPHEKSMTLGRLATHIADTIGWVSRVINITDFDFVANKLPTHTASSSEELLQIFQDNLDKALADLEKSTIEDLDVIWTVRVGDKVMYEIIKKVAIRAWAFSHLVHHRGQLSVYLRILDVPVPGMYGPSADEQ